MIHFPRSPNIPVKKTAKSRANFHPPIRRSAATLRCPRSHGLSQGAQALQSVRFPARLPQHLPAPRNSSSCSRNG
jgi:hypothetical protein